MQLQVNKWGCHDVKYLNAVMKIPTLSEIRISLYDQLNKFHQEVFLWNNMKRLGTHDLMSNYFSIDLFYKEFSFNLEFAGDGDKFVYKITPLSIDENIKFLVAGLLRWGTIGNISVTSNEITIETMEERDVFTVLGKQDQSTLINSLHSGLVFSATAFVYVRCNHTWSADVMESYLKERRIAAETELARSGGELKDSVEAVVKGVLWNTFYDPTLQDMCTSISRQWCNGLFGDIFGSYILAEWDTFFASLLGGAQDKRLAYLQVYNIIGQVTERGFLPNAGSQRGKSNDRSQPPVGSYCVYKLYKQFCEKDLLYNTFDKLVTWHKWWWAYRDGNCDGLLEWGSDFDLECEQLGYDNHSLLASKYESGLDNSPMYDEVLFNENTNTMELADVGLNSLFALDAWALGKIAEEIGNCDIAAQMNLEYSELKQRINEKLWCEEKGIYLNRFWDGNFSFRMSPTCFYPMLAGIASKEQAEKMVEEHLLNPEEFWGEYVIPSNPKSEKEYYDNVYWRGRIWAPMNFLVNEGLKRYSFHEIANEFASKSLILFRKEWEEKNHIHENYNSITGDGDDTLGSDPVYHWGGLLAYIAVSEVIEAQPWGDLRFGNLTDKPCEVKNFPIGQDKYSVVIYNGMKVYRNGLTIIETTPRVMICDYCVKDNCLFLHVITKGHSQVKLFDLSGLEKVCVFSEQKGRQEFISPGEILLIEI